MEQLTRYFNMKTISEKLFDLSIPEPNSGCRIWLGSTNSDPNVNRNARPIVYDDEGKQIQAHRASYREFVGELTDSENVLHICDTPLCIEPNHLYKGDQLNNVSDCRNRSRNTHLNKTHCPYGHKYDKENTYLLHGSRHCRSCMRIRNSKNLILVA